MKPSVILVNDKLTKEDIEKIIDEAYNAGYSDGYDAGRRLSDRITFEPTTPYYPWNPIIYTDREIPYNPYEVTCNDIKSALDVDNAMHTVQEAIENWMSKET